MVLVPFLLPIIFIGHLAPLSIGSNLEDGPPNVPLPASLLFQMADLLTTRQHNTSSLSADQMQQQINGTDQHHHPPMPSPTTKMPSLSPMPTTTTTTVMSIIEDRKRSASVEEGQEQEEHGKSHVHSSNHHRNRNTTVWSSSSSHHIKKSSSPYKKRGEAGSSRRVPSTPSSNWHELSSTEQSIALMLRCQELDTRHLLPAATTCRNLRSDKVCNYLFHPIDTKTARRDVKCNLQGLEDIAESCRKTCGICCEDINYACEDDKNGIVDCTRQLDKCHQKKWFGVLSRFCAGSCGLCAMTACRDYDNSCRVRKALCLKPESLDYMRENCARTCGFCVVGEVEKEEAPKGPQNGKDKKDNDGKPVVVERPEPKKPNTKLNKHTLVVPECTDKANNCSSNANLCGSPIYGEYMIKFCTKTCLGCGEARAGKRGHAAKPVPAPIEVIIEPIEANNNSEGGKRNSIRQCEDREERCAQWKREGLCEKDGEEERVKKRELCPKSCGTCAHHHQSP